MDIESARAWAGTISLVISTGGLIYMWIKAPGEKVKATIEEMKTSTKASIDALKAETTSALDALKSSTASGIDALKASTGTALDELKEEVVEDLKTHDRRIQRVEDDMRHLPTKEDLGKVTNALTAVETQVQMMGKVVDRIDVYLRDHE